MVSSSLSVALRRIVSGSPRREPVFKNRANLEVKSAGETTSTWPVDAILLPVTIAVGRLNAIAAAVVTPVLKEHSNAAVMGTRGQSSRN